MDFADYNRFSFRFCLGLGLDLYLWNRPAIFIQISLSSRSTIGFVVFQVNRHRRLLPTHIPHPSHPPHLGCRLFRRPFVCVDWLTDWLVDLLSVTVNLLVLILER